MKIPDTSRAWMNMTADQRNAMLAKFAHLMPQPAKPLPTANGAESKVNAASATPACLPAEPVHAYQLFEADAEPRGFEDIAEIFKAVRWPKMANYRTVRGCVMDIIDAIHSELERESQRRVGATGELRQREDGRRHLIEYLRVTGLDDRCGASAVTLADSIHDAVVRFAEAGGNGGIVAQSSPVNPGFVTWVCGGPDASERFDSDDLSGLGLALASWAMSQMIGAQTSLEQGQLRSNLRAIRRWLGTFAGLPTEIFDVFDRSCSALDPASADADLASQTLLAGASRLAECWARMRLASFLSSREAGVIADLAGQTSQAPGGDSGDSPAVVLCWLSLICSGGWPPPETMGGRFRVVHGDGGDGWAVYRHYLQTIGGLLRETGERLVHDPGEAPAKLKERLDYLASEIEAEAGTVEAKGEIPRDSNTSGLIERIVKSARVCRVRAHSLFLFAALHGIEPKKLVAKPGLVDSRFVISAPHLPGVSIPCGRPVMEIRLPEVP